MPPDHRGCPRNRVTSPVGSGLRTGFLSEQPAPLRRAPDDRRTRLQPGRTCDLRPGGWSAAGKGTAVLCATGRACARSSWHFLHVVNSTPAWSDTSATTAVMGLLPRAVVTGRLCGPTDNRGTFLPVEERLFRSGGLSRGRASPPGDPGRVLLRAAPLRLSPSPKHAWP